MSVEPAVDFGAGHGELVLGDYTAAGGRVDVLRADRVVYIAEEWYGRVRDGLVPWAVLVRRGPWDLGVLKIRGAAGMVVYEVTGTCGPRVRAYLAEQPD